MAGEQDMTKLDPPSPALPKPRPAGSGLLIGTTGLALLMCGGLLVYGAGRGVDLTDEIFYLIWTRNPQAYALTYQPFGYLLHPLFVLMGGNLAHYRLAGFGIAAGAGGLLGLSLARHLDARAGFAVYGALAALTIFFPWIITPSYNSAANVGAMLIVAGLLMLTDGGAGRTAAGTIAAAGGLCCACFAKPPLFAIGVLLIVAFGVSRRPVRRAVPFLASLLLAALLISLLLAPPGMIALVRRIVMSQHVLALPNQALGLPAKIARDFLAVPALLVGAVVAAAGGFAPRRFGWSRWVAWGAIGLSLLYMASVAGDALDGGIPDFIGMAMVTLGAGYVGLLREQRGENLWPVALLLIAPFAVALGTFNNQWFQLNFSMAFPLLALFALAAADAVRWRRVAAYAFAVVSPVLVMLLAAFFPYSLPASIFEQKIPIEAPLAQGTIRVDEETAAFVQAAHGQAQGALLIDLSGTGPGVAVALGGQAPVLAWLNPATPTWPDVVWSRLSETERAQAWFVGPIWPQFAHSAAARWLASHQGRFCPITLPETPFWGEERRLQLWRPCMPEPQR